MFFPEHPHPKGITMALMEKIERYDELLDHLHEIRREQINFNDSVSSSLLNRNKSLNFHLNEQNQKNKLIVRILSASIFLHIVTIICIIATNAA